MKSIENVGHTRRLMTLVSVVLMLACGALAGLWMSPHFHAFTTLPKRFRSSATASSSACARGEGKHFPLAFSRTKIDQNTKDRLTLVPARGSQ
jgi:hypothetical protein